MLSTKTKIDLIANISFIINNPGSIFQHCSFSNLSFTSNSSELFAIIPNPSWESALEYFFCIFEPLDSVQTPNSGGKRLCKNQNTTNVLDSITKVIKFHQIKIN